VLQQVAMGTGGATGGIMGAGWGVLVWQLGMLTND